jgi:predicted amidohydrolase
MKVGFFQFAPALHDVAANLSHITHALADVDADLLVLPEMCTTGYLFPSRAALAEAAETVPGPTTDVMLKLSRDRDCALVFGMPEKSGERIFNSSVLVTPEGDCHVYRKAHLFMDEKQLFTPGDLPFPVFDLRHRPPVGRPASAASSSLDHSTTGPLGHFLDVKLGMLVCFDHFFPEAARALALKGAQVICHCANLVLDVAQTTTQVRALENRVFWVMANRTGTETMAATGHDHCHSERRPSRSPERSEGEESPKSCPPPTSLRFTGASQMVGPDGKIIYRAGPASEEVYVIEIDPARALDKHATPLNDLFTDRRTDLY